MFSTVCAWTSDFAGHTAGFKLNVEPSHTLDDQDKDVFIAVRALGDMRSRAVTHPHAPSAEPFATPIPAHRHEHIVSV